MRNWRFYIARIFCGVGLMLLLAACTIKNPLPPSRILLYYPNESTNRLNHEVMVKELRRVFDSPDRFQLSIYEPKAIDIDSMQKAYEDTIMALIERGESPDEIVTVGDLATYLTLRSDLPAFRAIPIVFMAVESPELLPGNERRANITGLIEKLDIEKNINMIRRLENVSKVSTDVGNARFDSLIVSRIGIQLSDTAEYHYDRETGVISVLKVPEIQNGSNVVLCTTDMLYTEKLNLNKDLRYYTMTPGSFYPSVKKGGSIGGYFAPAFVMAAEAKKKVDDIASGLLPSRVPIEYHHSDYWINWKEFEREGVFACDLPQYVNYLNLPWYKANEFAYWTYQGGWVYILIGFIGIMAVLLLLLYFMNHKEERRLLKLSVKAANRQHFVAASLATTKTYFWYYVDGDIVLSEDTARRLGIHRYRISLKSLLRFIPNEHSQKRLSKILQSREKHGDNRVLRIELVDTNQKLHTIDINVTHVDIEDDVVPMGTFMLMDERMNAQAEIRNSLKADEESQMRESFLASMGHEIRTPINAIVGFSRLLIEQRDELQTEEKEMFMQMIQSNEEQLLTLLGNVMQYSAESDQLKNTMITVHVEELVTEIYRTHSVIVPRNLKFFLEEGEKNLNVHVSRTSIRQILSNLLNNACKFTPNGSITLGWKVEEDKVVIYVRDTGIGLTEEDLENVFSLYFKKDSTTDGAGIGLSLCSKLAVAMNGALSATSKFGEGSCFMLKLPIVK